MGNLVWKVLSLGAGIAAGKAATAITNKTWSAATGKGPKSAKDPNAAIAEAVLYTALSTGVMAAAKMFAERRAADFYTKSTGHPPAALVKKAEKEAKQQRQGKGQTPTVIYK